MLTLTTQDLVFGRAFICDPKATVEYVDAVEPEILGTPDDGDEDDDDEDEEEDEDEDDEDDDEEDAGEDKEEVETFDKSDDG